MMINRMTNRRVLLHLFGCFAFASVSPNSSRCDEWKQMTSVTNNLSSRRAKSESINSMSFPRQFQSWGVASLNKRINPLSTTLQGIKFSCIALAGWVITRWTRERLRIAQKKGHAVTFHGRGRGGWEDSRVINYMARQGLCLCCLCFPVLLFLI